MESLSYFFWLGIYAICSVAILNLSGCADIKVPSTGYTLSHPITTKTMVTLGTTKDEIIEDWGAPSKIVDMGYDDTGLKKELWIYEAWFPKTPLDYRHFSRRKRIYFVGDYVSGFEDAEDKDVENKKD